MVFQKNSREKVLANPQNVQKKIKIEFKTDNVDINNKNIKSNIKNEEIEETIRINKEIQNEKQ